jgi:hypothetical protein
MSKSHRHISILLITLLIGGFILFLTWAGRQAATHGSRISDPAYYSKGLKYTHTQVEKQAAASQGWHLRTEVGPGQLSFILLDITEQPIAQASGELTLYLSAQKKILQLHAVEDEAGRYRFDLPEPLSGSLPARVEFALQGSRISRQLLINF